MPVLSFESGSEVGDFTSYGCPKLFSAENALASLPETYEPYSEIFERARAPIGRALGISDENIAKVDYQTLSNYSGTIIRSQFEGVLA